jgi:hypothetical protein
VIGSNGGYQASYDRSCVLLEGGDGVGVDVQGHGHGRVAEPFADDLGMHPGLEGQGGVGVTQVVETDPGKPSFL